MLQLSFLNQRLFILRDSLSLSAAHHQSVESLEIKCRRRKYDCTWIAI